MENAQLYCVACLDAYYVSENPECRSEVVVISTILRCLFELKVNVIGLRGLKVKLYDGYFPSIKGA